MYDVIVIGAGAAGLTAAGFAGKVNAQVAIVEKDRVGGDCTWTGCVPSKALLKVAKVAHAMRTAHDYGLGNTEPNVDMTAVRDYILNAVQRVYQHETPNVFSEEYHVEFVMGSACFIDSHTIQVGDQTLQAKKFVIAVGARPSVPSIPGLNTVDYKTNVNIFENDRLPDHLLVMGAGPIGAEMAQAYARLGAKVTLMDEVLLPNDELEARKVIQTVLEREGVSFVPALVESVSQTGGQISVELRNGLCIMGDMLLVAVGRSPNIEDLALDVAGVIYETSGIIVDKYLRTNLKHIYAIGDCTAAPKFTHYASFQGGIAAANALFPIVNSTGQDMVMPWVTYVDPEVAHVGLTEVQAQEQFGDQVKVYMFPLTKGDRAVSENDMDGFIKIVYRGSGELLGATIVADRAGEMITEFALVLKTGLKLRDIVNTMHAYPTYSDIVRKAVSMLLIDELFKGTSGKVVNLVTKTLI